MRAKAILIVFLIATILGKTEAQTYIDTFGSTIVHVDAVVDSAHFAQTNTSGWPGPWDLHWGPDNQLWFSNNSRIEKYNPVNNVIKTLAKISKGYIMGITTHLDFEEQPYVYAAIDTGGYYASTFDHIIVYRFTYNSALDTLTNAIPMLNWFHISEHSGGRLLFGRDKKLYVTTAEYFKEYDTLFYNSGKVLRVNADGTVPADNPKADYTYTWGHRNPQGITQTSKGKIITSEFGFNNDELNLIEKNYNYGWWIWDGDYCIASHPDTCTYYYPLCKHPIDIGENPPSGIDYYSHRAIPSLNGIIEGVTGNRGTQGIMVYGLNGSHAKVSSKNRFLISKSNPYICAFGRIRDVCTAPNGQVYFIGYDRTLKPAIYRINNPSYCTGQVGLVSNFNDSGPGSLREAIECAYDGGTISFDANLINDTIKLTSGPIEINKKINLTSPFSSPIKIKSSNNGASPLFYIGQFGSLSLNKFNLYAANNTGDGRIIINDGKLNLTDVQIIENTTSSGSAVLNLPNAQINVNASSSIKKL
jgi:aldose sugar dehydrogenase